MPCDAPRMAARCLASLAGFLCSAHTCTTCKAWGRGCGFVWVGEAEAVGGWVGGWVDGGGMGGWGILTTATAARYFAVLAGFLRSAHTCTSCRVRAVCGGVSQSRLQGSWLNRTPGPCTFCTVPSTLHPTGHSQLAHIAHPSKLTKQGAAGRPCQVTAPGDHPRTLPQPKAQPQAPFHHDTAAPAADPACVSLTKCVTQQQVHPKVVSAPRPTCMALSTHATYQTTVKHCIHTPSPPA